MGDLFEGGAFSGSFSDPADVSGSAAQERATKAQSRQNEQERALKQKFAEEARADVKALFPVADLNRNLGFQSALDVFGQSVPQQFSAFQEGNVGAQQALLAGLPQIQNAILGLPMDLSGFQPQSVGFNTDFAQQQLPDFITSTQALQEGDKSGIPGQIAAVEQRLARAIREGGRTNRNAIPQIQAELEALQGRASPLGGSSMIGRPEMKNPLGGIRRTR